MSDWSEEVLLEIDNYFKENFDKTTNMQDENQNKPYVAEELFTHIVSEKDEESNEEILFDSVNEIRKSKRRRTKVPGNQQDDSSSDDNIPLADLKRFKDKAGLVDDFDDTDNDEDYHPDKNDFNSSDSNISHISSDESFNSDSTSERIKGKKRLDLDKSGRDKAWKKKGKTIQRKKSRVQKQLFNEDNKKRINNAKQIAKSKRSIPSKKDLALEMAKARSEKELNDRRIREMYHLSRLDMLLSSNGLKRVHIQGDGDCFFNAIRCQLTDDLSTKDLRSNVCQHLLDNMQHYLAFLICQDGEEPIEVYRKQVEILRQSGNWKERLADCLPLAFANMYQRPIRIFSSNTTNPVFDVKPTMGICSDECIRLAYIEIPGSEHYEGIQRCDRIGAGNNLSNTSTAEMNSEECFCQNIDIQSTPSKPDKNNTSQYHVTPHKDAHYRSPIRKELRRRKKAQPELWKRNVRRRNRLSGLPYISQKGKEIAERKMGHVNCSKCTYQCDKKVSSVERTEIFTTYWQLQDYKRQRDFICQHVKSSKPRRSSGHKSITYEYFFSVRNEKVRVCRTFFLKTLGIGKKTVHLAVGRKNAGIFASDDSRGKQQSVNKTPSESIEMVRKHIESFPKMQSHYIREQSKKEYLSVDLNIKKMWLLYCEMCKTKGVKAVTEKKYRDIFCEEYNLSFFKPKKDQCSTCTLYDSLKMRQLLDTPIEKEYQEHQERKLKSREEKEKDKEKAKEDKDFHAATFDLQAVLSAPCCLVGELYYKRKLSCYNLSFYSLGDKNGTCYLWDETQGGRGSCEIATCLQIYINSVTSRCSTVKEITLYSDTCGGQNRNQFMVAGLLHIVNQDGSLDIINQKFFERGHSQMESDSIHSSIETAKKNTSVYVPSQWNTIISVARRNNPYVVVPLKFTDFKDFKELAKKFCPNMKSTTSNTRVNWLKIKWIQVRRSHPKSIFVGTNFDERNLQEIEVQAVTRQKGRPRHWPEALTPLYSRKLPISSSKKADLLSLCSSGIIPQEFHQYYRKIPASKKAEDKIPMPDADESDSDTDYDD